MAAPSTDVGDPFSDPLIRLIAWVIAIVVVLSLIGLVVIYWGDEFAVPSWNEDSVPPPKND